MKFLNYFFVKFKIVENDQFFYDFLDVLFDIKICIWYVMLQDYEYIIWLQEFQLVLEDRKL